MNHFLAILAALAVYFLTGCGKPTELAPQERVISLAECQDFIRQREIAGDIIAVQMKVGKWTHVEYNGQQVGMTNECRSEIYNAR